MIACFLHDWTRWKDISSGLLGRVEKMTRAAVADSPDIGRFILQERECKRCGKKELQSARALFRRSSAKTGASRACGTA